MVAKEIYEAFRKALLEVLIPEIKNLQVGQEKLRAELKKDMARLMHTQEMILEKLAILDLGNRITKSEVLIEQLQKRVA